MHAVQRIRNNPIAIFGALAVALFVWILVDYLASRFLNATHERVAVSDPPHRSKYLPPAPSNRPAMQPHPVLIEVLPKLMPGMPRIEVEKLLGPPAPHQLQPVSQVNGRFTYCSAYELLDPEPPLTIRPIRPKSSQSTPTPGEAKILVTIEYDASKPGHPLLAVHYPDPLF